MQYWRHSWQRSNDVLYQNKSTHCAGLKCNYCWSKQGKASPTGRWDRMREVWHVWWLQMATTTRMKPILLHFDLLQIVPRSSCAKQKELRYTQSRIGYVLLWHFACVCLSLYSRSSFADCHCMEVLVSSSISLSGCSRISTNVAWCPCAIFQQHQHTSTHPFQRPFGVTSPEITKQINHIVGNGCHGR